MTQRELAERRAARLAPALEYRETLVARRKLAKLRTLPVPVRGLRTWNVRIAEMMGQGL